MLKVLTVFLALVEINFGGFVNVELRRNIILKKDILEIVKVGAVRNLLKVGITYEEKYAQLRKIYEGDKDLLLHIKEFEKKKKNFSYKTTLDLLEAFELIEKADNYTREVDINPDICKNLKGVNNVTESKRPLLAKILMLTTTILTILPFYDTLSDEYLFFINDNLQRRLHKVLSRIKAGYCPEPKVVSKKKKDDQKGSLDELFLDRYVNKVKKS